MKTRPDNILLSILWLMACTLGGSFWLNIKFGFNAFAQSHWQYLSYIQASGGHVNIWFYISIALCIALAITGLYIIIHPNIVETRKRHTSIKTAKQTQTTPASQPTQTSPVAIEPKSQIQRPHLYSSATQPRPTMPTVPHPAPHPTTQPKPQTDEIKNIFESAGYTVKNAPTINGIKTSVLAIGTDEILWLGAENISFAEMSKMVEKLNGIFTDTLEDIKITINTFIISPTGNASEYGDILSFANIEKLSEYMGMHTNPELPDSDDGNFDAYSDYISTVVQYIGNI